MVLDPMPGPNPQPRANGIVGQGVRILDHRGLYSTLAGTEGPPQRAPRAMFAAFPLDLSLAPNPQMFMLPVQQPKRFGARGAGRPTPSRHSLGSRADRLRPGRRRRHGAGPGPDGDYELRVKYLVGADGGTSSTRKLAGIDFPGMTSHDAVARMGFDVLPPAEWVDPISGALDVPGFGRIPPAGVPPGGAGRFRVRRTGAPGGGDRLRVGPDGPGAPGRSQRWRAADEPGRTGGQPRAGHRRGGAVAAGIARAAA